MAEPLQSMGEVGEVKRGELDAVLAGMGCMEGDFNFVNGHGVYVARLTESFARLRDIPSDNVSWKIRSGIYKEIGEIVKAAMDEEFF